MGRWVRRWVAICWCKCVHMHARLYSERYFRLFLFYKKDPGNSTLQKLQSPVGEWRGSGVWILLEASSN